MIQVIENNNYYKHTPFISDGSCNTCKTPVYTAPLLYFNIYLPYIIRPVHNMYKSMLVKFTYNPVFLIASIYV